ncbi:hypothetical protein BYT27DRAFT_7254827 [Phlegmacium glaucopus]|nr:hypothetical protein BYT27DRAFT_7254827 [Phlegmacium glaucopus]
MSPIKRGFEVKAPDLDTREAQRLGLSVCQCYDMASSSFDEPINYLEPDRISLAVLIEALKVFDSGVPVITHNRDFSKSLCKEVWSMRLEVSGHNRVERMSMIWSSY